MRVGFFGDSYIDVGSEINRTNTAWPEIITQKINCTPYFAGEAGTSIWRAYRNFIEIRDKCDVVVFCFSSYHRWPHLPEHLRRKEWLTHFYLNEPENLKDEEIKKIIDMYPVVFDDHLLKFICESVFKDINNWCAEKNKYLVNVLCFDKSDFRLSKTEFPILSGLNDISWSEDVLYKGEYMNAKDWLFKKTDGGDYRSCHLNNNNNYQLGEIITNLISSKTTNINVDLYKQYKWSKL